MNGRKSTSPAIFSTVTDLLMHRAETQPYSLAFRFLDVDNAGVEEWSYADLDARARAIAAQLQEFNCEGNRALLLYPSGLEFIAAFFGCLYARVIAVPLNPPHPVRPQRTVARLRTVAADCTPRFLLMTSRLLESREIISKQAAELTSLEWLATDSIGVSAGSRWRRPDIPAESLAFLQYTSGSTGHPKGVMNCHSNVLDNERAISFGFGSNAAAHVVGWLPLFHDMGLIGNVLHSVYVGCGCTLMSPAAFLKRPIQWLTAIGRYGGTISGGPNFAYDLCMRKIAPIAREQLDLSSWEVAYNGSEPIRTETMEDFATAFAPCGFRREAFLPCYGLAEATLFVTGSRRDGLPYQGIDHSDGSADKVEKVKRRVSTGKAAPDHEVRIVDPKTRRPGAGETVGEIWVGGPSVAAGYWNSPEETESTFRALLADRDDVTFLRTGDLGFIVDGELYVTGRLKDLIILRGRNLYPQDIEATTERAHSAIRVAGVAAFSFDVEGEERLGIVVEANLRSDAKEIQEIYDAVRAAVAEEHSANVHTLVLTRANSIPKTSSGKIRRHACREEWLAGRLPVLAVSVSQLTAAPELDAEGAEPFWHLELEFTDEDGRRELFRDLVRRELASSLSIEPGSVRLDASLAELGADSLRVLEIQTRLEEKLRLQLGGEPFSWATATGNALIETLACAWDQRDSIAPNTRITPGPAASEAPVSSGQQRLYLLENLTSGVPVYNVHFGVRITGTLNPALLERSFEELVLRHAALRSVIVERDGLPYQAIESENRIRLESIDLGETPLAGRENRLEALAREQSSRPFDLQTGPLTRAMLVRLTDTHFVLLVTQHHIITDGWSIERLVTALAEIYRTMIEGTPQPSPPQLEFADFARWELGNTANNEDSRSFWANNLSELPRLDLPFDLPPVAVRSYKGGQVRFQVPRGVGDGLVQLSAEQRCTPFVTLLAAYAVLLHRYTGQDNFAIGSVYANRHPQVNDVLGFFANTVVLRCDLAGEPHFLELMQRTHSVVAQALRHGSFPFAEIVKAVDRARMGVENPLFQASLVLESRNRSELTVVGTHWTSVSWAPDGAVEGTAKFDLAMALERTPEGFLGTFEYNCDRFKPSTVERMAAAFQMLLGEILAHSRLPINQLNVIPAGERRLFSAWNETTCEIGDVCFPQLFERQTTLTGSAIAVTDSRTSLSYEELNNRANRVARQLRQNGLAPDDLVALLMPRSVELLVSILGVFKAGGAYVPIDPEYPQMRRAEIMTQSGATRLITTRELEWMVEPMLDETALSQLQTLFIDDVIAGDEVVDNPPALATLRNLAYVIYTSGSTGRPKGAMVEHLGMLNHLLAKVRDLNLSPDDVIAQNASQCFDISVWQYLAALLAGARVEIVDSTTAGEGSVLFRYAAERRITILEMVPALLRSALAEPDQESAPISLRWLLLTGEALPPELVHSWFDRHSSVPIINAYGPTECSDDVTHFSIRDAAALNGSHTPIGRAISNTRLYVLDRFMQPVPLGVSGELYVAGLCVGRGYLRDPSQTAKVFVPDPFAENESARLYRTGDVVRVLSSGDIVFLGRTDQQVKVRGFRVEPGEIQTILEEQPAVAAAVVMTQKYKQDLRLVAYVQLQTGGSLSELRSTLKQRLPDYMVPSLFIPVDQFPLNLNGKIDYNALAQVGADVVPQDEAYQAPRGAIEELLAQVWSGVLGVGRVGVGDNFFELGGHSLLATQVMSRVRTSFGVELPLRTLFERPTVAGLGQEVERALGAGEGAGAVALKAVARTGELPLSFAQQRLWFLEQLQPGSDSYNVPGAVRIEGRLEVALLQQTLNEIVRRHEVLRTRFVAEAGEPRQLIEAESELALPVIAVASREQGERLMREEAAEPFDLARGPLLRARLLSYGEQEAVLLLTMHHIISDGWSLGVLVREASQLYRALLAGEPSPLAELAVQYADYSVWQREWLQGEVLEKELSYWRGQLEGAPEALELPTDGPRQRLSKHRAGQQRVGLRAAEMGVVRELAQAEGVTLYMVLLAAFEVLLYRYTGQEDICIGTPIAGRTRQETEELIGFFVNTLVIRGDLSGGPTTRELLRQVRQTTLEAYAHQELPFERLVEELRPERELSRTPLFQVMFILQNAPLPALELGEARLEVVGQGAGTAKFELTLSLEEQSDGSVAGYLEYSRELFGAERMARMAGHYERLVREMAAAPEQRVGLVALLSEAEREEQLVRWNATSASYPERCLHQLFEEQVERTPQAVAVIFNGRSISYRELNSQANRIAHYLLSRGEGKDSRVGIFMQRSPAMVAAILGVLKTGAAYVPLDPSYPGERLRHMADLARLGSILVDGPAPDPFAASIQQIDVSSNMISCQSNQNTHSATELNDAAYVVFTSGSTGVPNGVVGLHRGTINRCAWMWREFPFAPHERSALKTSTNFVDSVWEIFGPLLQGVPSVTFNSEQVRDVELFINGLAEGQVTRLIVVPSLLHAMLETEPALAQRLPLLRYWTSSGETLPADLVQTFHERLPGRILLNLYGSSEASGDSTFTVVSSADGVPVPIGKPISNTQIFILDGRMQPVPVGVPGEIYIGGDGLSGGYLFQPDLTATRFVANSLPEWFGTQLYRTLDVGRFRSDSSIDYVGRVDRQIKVRGMRVNLGEIESVLLTHPQVNQAIVTLRPAGQRIVAYVMAADIATAHQHELRKFLSERLPEHMIPAAFVVLSVFPLTPNGKVNYSALPDPTESLVDRGGIYQAPRGAIEELLAQVWSGVLGVGRVGAGDNFFELGGHSLLATQVMSRVRTSFGVELPLRTLFERPTVAGLGQEVERALGAGEGAGAVALKAVARTGELPLSFAQQRLWFLEQLQPGSDSYNVPGAVRIEGPLEVALLQQTLNEIVRRHEVLRTRFVAEAGEPRQLIEAESELALPVIAVASREQGERLMREEAAEPFDLARGPLLRARLLSYGEQEAVLLLTMHHIISDGWSLGVLVREASQLYRALLAGEPSPLAELAVQYADYSVWQREWLQGEVLEKELSYWRGQLEGAPEALELPTDGPRQRLSKHRAGQQRVGLRAAEMGVVRELAQAEGVTLYMVLLAAFEVLLYRYTGQEDICIGTPIAGRTRQETEELIGFFVNTLVIRGDLSGGPTTRELLRQVRQTTLEAYAHQELPFERLVEELRPERELSRTPLFQVMFILQNAPLPALELGEARLEVVGQGAGTAKFELTLSLEEQSDGSVAGYLEYSRELFGAERMARMAGHYERLVREMAAAPEQRVGLVALLSEAEREEQLVSWNATSASYPERCLHQLFEEQVERTPQAVAVIFNGRSISYRELDQSANQLAHSLCKRGVRIGDRVGILLERSPEMVVALLGILKAGAAYVPLDPEYPDQRVAFMVDDAQATITLTQERLAQRLPSGARSLMLNSEWQIFGGQSEERCRSNVTPHDLVYLLHTSGSTGWPKGSMLTHLGVVNCLCWMQQRYQLNPADRFLFKTSLNFDPSVWEIFWPLMVGATVVIAPPAAQGDPEQLLDIIERHQVTSIYFVPSMLNVFLDGRQLERAASLKRVICGGEKLSAESITRYFDLMNAELHHSYGPTETSIAATEWTCDPSYDVGVVPMGRPMGNVHVYVLDRKMEPVPQGAAGELYIGGAGVCLGYLGRATLTAQSFVPNPFSKQSGDRLYRTGDRVRYLPDGNLEFLARCDDQVKLRGYRIEPGEIERALEEHEAVKQALVTVRADGGEPRLVAYVVLHGTIEIPVLKESLNLKLPGYMIPSVIMPLPEMPLAINGKIDRRALPAPDETPRSLYVAPRNETEATLAAIWAELLSLERVGIDDDFFEVGGHSLLATRLVSRINNTFQADLPLVRIFELRSIKQLAPVIEATKTAPGSRGVPIVRAARHAVSVPVNIGVEE